MEFYYQTLSDREFREFNIFVISIKNQYTVINIITTVDDYIKIDEFELDEDLLEKSNVNNDDYEHLYFSELSNQQVGEHQLKEDSIIWKSKQKILNRKLKNLRKT